MSQAERTIERPAPLRVRVVSVTVRESLITERRRGREAVSPGLVVVQRPVRIISDPPPPPEVANDQDGVMASRVRAAAEDLYELEPLESLELDEDELESSSGEQSRIEPRGDRDEDAEELDVSVPPPAPPEALRRSTSSPALPPVRLASPLPPAPATPPPPRASAGRSEPVEEIEVEVEPHGGLESLLQSDPTDDTTVVGALTRAPRVEELRPTKPRSHAWWEVFFDDDYLRTVRPPSREQIARQCDFIERRLGLKSGASLLDVGCGLGLHVLELTARGYATVGLDLSLAMLSRASEEAQTRGLRVNFLHADMRELGFEASFDAVTCLGTSLGYFDDETNRRVLERLFRALKPGGVLLLDVVNRDHVIRAQPNLIWFEGDGCVCMEESEFNYFTSRLQVKRTVILDTGKQIENEYSLRLYSLHELGQLMNASGFRVAEVSGREALPGVFFGQESPNLLIVAERRPAGEPGGSAGNE